MKFLQTPTLKNSEVFLFSSIFYLLYLNYLLYFSDYCRNVTRHYFITCYLFYFLDRLFCPAFQTTRAFCSTVCERRLSVEFRELHGFLSQQKAPVIVWHFFRKRWLKHSDGFWNFGWSPNSNRSNRIGYALFSLLRVAELFTVKFFGRPVQNRNWCNFLLTSLVTRVSQNFHALSVCRKFSFFFAANTSERWVIKLELSGKIPF